MDRWEELLLPQRLDLHHLHHSGLPDVAAYAAEELEASLMDYKALRHAYELAEQRRLGVYCEYRTR